MRTHTAPIVAAGVPRLSKVPNSKFISAGFPLTIEDGIAPGVDLILDPLVIPDPDFPAHASCNFLSSP